jgi:probable HAF family extracellular repeat protein
MRTLACLTAAPVPAAPWGVPEAPAAWYFDLSIVDCSVDADTAGSAIAATMRSRPNHTNGNGLRVGAVICQGRECAALFDGDQIVEIRMRHSDDASSRALAINDAGVVVGLSRRGLNEHAFIWQGGRVSGLGGLGDARDPRSLRPLQASRARAINSAGQVVGRAATEDRVFGFLWSFRHGLLDLGALLFQHRGEPAWRIADAHAVGDCGRILATGVRDGCYHQVLLEPRRRKAPRGKALAFCRWPSASSPPTAHHTPGDRPCTP